jgi:zona occludens toxin (predicted ATPase)
MHCDKMAVTKMLFRQRVVIEFLVKQGNSTSISDFVVCMEMTVEGGWNILRTETRTSPISRAVVDRELLPTQRNKQNIDELNRKDRRITVTENAYAQQTSLCASSKTSEEKHLSSFNITTLGFILHV